MATRERARTWWTVTIIGAAAATATEVLMFWLNAPHQPPGGPSTGSLSVVFLDLFVLVVAAVVACVSAVAAFGFAYAFLNHTTIWKTATLAYAAVLLEIVFVGRRDPVNAWLFSYPTLLAAGVASVWLFGERLPVPLMPESANHAANGDEVAAILRFRDVALKTPGGVDDRANVIPILQHYAALQDSVHREQFQGALEQLLASEDEEIRSYAVTVCLGFVAFRHAV